MCPGRSRLERQSAVDVAQSTPVPFVVQPHGGQAQPRRCQRRILVQGSEGGAKGSLLDEIDRTVTAMGGRLLRSWLLRPLVSLERIRDRLDAVEELAFRSTDRGRFRETLKAVHDLERTHSLVRRLEVRAEERADRRVREGPLTEGLGVVSGKPRVVELAGKV